MLVQTLNSNGFLALFDFLYMPMNFGTKTYFGYASINFVRSEIAERFLLEFMGFGNWLVDSPNEAFVEWSGERQGLVGQIERYRNSAMMHQNVPDAAKPIMLQGGVRVPFPSPTQTLKPLRVRAWKKQQAPNLGAEQSPLSDSNGVFDKGQTTSSPRRRKQDASHNQRPDAARSGAAIR